MRAFRSGVVTKLATAGRGGNAISLGHADGWGSYYAHLSQFYVALGQAVRAGQVIGLSGESGPVTGPHLHFAIYTPDGGTVDPLSVISPGA